METRKYTISLNFAPQFKSYYVVWKQNSKGEVIEDVDTFKSYYVVWKPHYHFSENKKNKSLNRTM